ncbi:hypothetical protein Y88_1367 [Novosphingobium nitrogenifigens DSM 19370]|uniref:Type IV conjugative transfer system protein TraV n=1 Tax=Novosphingobium nitrogenifigens DSM 19370 TaxID=983920 RepID=F1Z7S0_9SPHN|nr:hypothetical protein [Novosphingobium nitrogenifigens]EGD59305.1 hypothetical protein Y88_1367 [Novosphingobium nitrogenifigens DSM 19370]
MRMSPIIAALGLMPLAGCSLFHSNVKGGFVCSAPRGTCAPSTTIDDSAIHAIDAEADSKNAPAPDGQTAASGTQASTNPKEKKAWTFVGPARPVLKIVYLPWRDGSGRLHPRTTGFVPVDAPLASELSSASLDAKAMGTGTEMSLLSLAELAPDMALMDPSPKPAMPAKPKADAAAPITPGDPVAAIKDKVKAILNQPQEQPGTPKPPAPQPTQAKTNAATFPPQGN